MSLPRAGVVASLCTIVLAACPATPAPGPIRNTGAPTAPAAADPSRTDGALWTCQIDDYDPQPCKLSQDGAGWRLVKLLGSQRFAGTVAWRGPDAIDFVGNFFCPWGDCGEEMNVRFERDATAFVTTFSNNTVTLRYDAALAGEWGGAGYGGLTGDER